MKIEMLFRLTGSKTLPVDHAHGLYGALKGLAPELEQAEGLGIHCIRGNPVPGGVILLNPKRSLLRLRIGVGDLPKALPLAGKSIEVLGSRFHLGAPELHQIEPSQALWARLVTLKFADATWSAAAQQLQAHLSKTYPAVTWEIRKPRTIRIHGTQILGFEVLAKGLTPEDSLRLQFEGVGGRRAFGCGIFVRVGDKQKTATEQENS